MSSNNIRQCPSCFGWFCTGSGGPTKHIHTCQHQSHVYGSLGNELVLSKNPLLSLTAENQSHENDYNCDLYMHQSYEENNHCYNDSYPLIDDDCSSHCLDDSLDQYYLIHHGNKDNQDSLPENASPQSDAPNRFQVMLHDLIIAHKASLHMFDDICNLVIEYTSSQEFSIHTKSSAW